MTRMLDVGAWCIDAFTITTTRRMLDVGAWCIDALTIYHNASISGLRGVTINRDVQ